MPHSIKSFSNFQKEGVAIFHNVAVAQATVVITEPELVLRSNPLGFHDPDYLTT